MLCIIGEQVDDDDDGGGTDVDVVVFSGEICGNILSFHSTLESKKWEINSLNRFWHSKLNNCALLINIDNQTVDLVCH